MIFLSLQNVKMLEGTDLYSAWAPLIPTAEQQPYQTTAAAALQEKEKDADDIPAPARKSSVAVQPTPPPQPQYNPSEFNSGQFNQYYDNEQKMLAIINELQKRNAAQTSASQKQSAAQGPSYFDRLASKKKDLIKFLHSALIIIFALSVHFLIHHYFGWYLSNNDVSFERELILRLLYPIGILFIGWNIMLIFK